jgi:hypothetical protein
MGMSDRFGVVFHVERQDWCCIHGPGRPEPIIENIPSAVGLALCSFLNGDSDNVDVSILATYILGGHVGSIELPQAGLQARGYRIDLRLATTQDPIQGSMQEAFDYRVHDVPDSLEALCFTRCIWSVQEGDGLVLERKPQTCWEAAHNALLQAAAPLMYQTLWAIQRGDPDSSTRLKETLEALKDPEWIAYVKEGPGGSGALSPGDVMAAACGRR